MPKKASTYFEPCYDHNCSVWDEKDVLDVDIKGEGCFSSLKRFWYNLFLLSFTDLRAKHFYTSSHAMKVARAIHFRHYRSSIHPLSKFRSFWDFFILHIMVLNKIFIHINSSMIHDMGMSIHYAALACDALVIYDVYVNFKTGYADKASRTIYMDPSYVMYKFLSTNLCIHVASAIPLEALLLLKYGSRINCSPCKCNMFVVTLRIFSLIGTIRLFEVSSIYNRERSSYKLTTFCKFLRTLILGMVSMLQMMTLSDALNMVCIIVEKSLDKRSYVSVLLMYRYTMELEDAGFLFFSLELSRISKSFLLFGYGLRPNETTFDKLSALIAFVIAYTFHMWIFVGMNSCFTRLTYSEDLYITNLDRTKNILRARQMPDVMHDKVNEYYQCKISTLALTEKQNGLFGALPKALKRDIVLSCYRKHVLRLPFFADWPFDVINEIALLLQQEVFLDKDVIGNAYTQSDGLVIVESGLLAVYSVRNEETCHLVDGDYFGELSLVTDKEMRMSTIVAATSCSILFLSKQHFRKLMRDHAQLFFDMKTKLNYANNRNWEGNEVIENDINTHRP
ncbi:hypothetical protein MSG28_001272 [Choristoneura fumiferana]|uniref:Uncharacterized protein n=1 Tax=Choristoneura fumiferana TaxID=7141 RepID=A0ACC0K4D8_CHOFU|nr:hypothetical protein MSG28_001272 [Choristoneura fumiferana]